MNDIVFIQNNLKKWAKDEAAPDIPLLNSALNPLIRKDPLGVVLVIGYVYRNSGCLIELTDLKEPTTSPSSYPLDP